MAARKGLNASLAEKSEDDSWQERATKAHYDALDEMDFSILTVNTTEFSRFALGEVDTLMIDDDAE